MKKILTVCLAAALVITFGTASVFAAPAALQKSGGKALISACGSYFVDADGDGVCDNFPNNCARNQDGTGSNAGTGVCPQDGTGNQYGNAGACPQDGTGYQYGNAGVCPQDGTGNQYGNGGAGGNGQNYVDADGDGVCDNYPNGCGGNQCGNAGGGGCGWNYTDDNGDGVCDNYPNGCGGNQCGAGACPQDGTGNQYGKW